MISVERLQDHLSSGFYGELANIILFEYADIDLYGELAIMVI